MIIQYRKSDWTVGGFDSDKLIDIRVRGNAFSIILRHYFYDGLEWEDEEITNVVEIRI